MSHKHPNKILTLHAASPSIVALCHQHVYQWIFPPEAAHPSDICFVSDTTPICPSGQKRNAGPSTEWHHNPSLDIL